jgi:hypothetical protein
VHPRRIETVIYLRLQQPEICAEEGGVGQSVPISECGERARVNGEGPPPLPDWWAWRKYGQKPIKGRKVLIRYTGL